MAVQFSGHAKSMISSEQSANRTAQSTQGDLFGDLDSVADGIGKRIAEGILGRIQSFPEREHVFAQNKLVV